MDFMELERELRCEAVQDKMRKIITQIILQHGLTLGDIQVKAAVSATGLSTFMGIKRKSMGLNVMIRLVHFIKGYGYKMEQLSPKLKEGI
jgi:hypothetical protein